MRVGNESNTSLTFVVLISYIGKLPWYQPFVFSFTIDSTMSTDIYVIYIYMHTNVFLKNPTLILAREPLGIQVLILISV